MTDETVFIQIDKLREQNRELKKEIIKLKSLNRRAAEEIRDLDDTIIGIVDNFSYIAETIGYDTDPLAPEGMASINLLNRLDGKTSGGYIENYEDLHLEMKTLDGYAQIEHPDFYHTQYLEKDKHSADCKWHKDWHACDCGMFDNEVEENDYSHNRSFCVAYQEGGVGCPDCYDFICDGCGKKCEGDPAEATITTENLTGVVMCEECSGGNTTERVEEQATRLEKIAEQKKVNEVFGQITSCAIKAAKQVMEEHSKAFEKLAESEE